jgi:hypothetical protein
MNLPKFTAEASLYATKGRWQSANRQRYTSGLNKVFSQLSFNPFPISTGAGLFGGLFCRLRCEMAYSSCLDTCEGTLDNPKPSLNCVICDEQHKECLKGCGSTLF